MGRVVSRTEIIDLSLPAEEGPSEAISPKVIHQGHKETASLLARLFRVRSG